MKAACAIVSIVVAVTILAIVCMVKFATEIGVEEKKRDINPGGVYRYSKLLGVITLNDNQSVLASERFPYVAAIMKIDTKTWSFSCFGSVILTRWVVTAAHCRKFGYTHRVLIYYDFARNYTHTYSVLLWRVHEKFNINNTTPMYDIAVAKFNVEMFPYATRPAVFDDKMAKSIEASVWKTVSTMDSKMYLTNDFEKFRMEVADNLLCYETYGVELNESMMCVDMAQHQDCFVTEFGPLFCYDRVVGVLAVMPRDCDNKLAIFTNVSFYYDWIIRSTHSVSVQSR